MVVGGHHARVRAFGRLLSLPVHCLSLRGLEAHVQTQANPHVMCALCNLLPLNKSIKIMLYFSNCIFLMYLFVIKEGLMSKRSDIYFAQSVTIHVKKSN